MKSQLPLIGFFVCAYAFTWVPGTLACWDRMEPIRSKVLLLLALVGPLEAAVLWAAIEGGKRGIKELFAHFFVTGFNPLWYLVAMSLPFACWAVARAIVHADDVLTGGAISILRPVVGLRQLPWLYFMNLLQGPLGEEPGWRGFALPRLQARYSPFTASLVLSVVWAFWHWPMWLLSPTASPFYLFWLSIIPDTLMLTWLYSRTRGSVLISILFHTSRNATTDLWLVDYSMQETWFKLTYIVAGAVVFAERRWFFRPNK